MKILFSLLYLALIGVGIMLFFIEFRIWLINPFTLFGGLFVGFGVASLKYEWKR